MTPEQRAAWEEAERAGFEADWLARHGWTLVRRPGEGYRDISIEYAFLGWFARAAQPVTASLTPDLAENTTVENSVGKETPPAAPTEAQIDLAIEVACQCVKGWEQRDYTVAHAAAVAMAEIMGGWLPIATAPRDRDILVYAPPYLGLPYIVCACRWHPEAGFCVDELRQPTMWREIDLPACEPGETS